MEKVHFESEGQTLALKKNAKALAFFVSLFLSGNEKNILPSLPAQARRSYKNFSPAFKLIIQRGEEDNGGIELEISEKMKIILDHYEDAMLSIDENIEQVMKAIKFVPEIREITPVVNKQTNTAQSSVPAKPVTKRRITKRAANLKHNAVKKKNRFESKSWGSPVSSAKMKVAKNAYNRTVSRAF